MGVCDEKKRKAVESGGSGSQNKFPFFLERKINDMFMCQWKCFSRGKKNECWRRGRGRLLLLTKWKGTGSSAQIGAWPYSSSSIIIGEMIVGRRYGRDLGKF